MDRVKLEQRLALADRNVSRGQELVARQTKIIEDMTLGGHDIAPATTLLRAFENTLVRHTADRDRISAELKGTSGLFG